MEPVIFQPNRLWLPAHLLRHPQHRPAPPPTPATQQDAALLLLMQVQGAAHEAGQSLAQLPGAGCGGGCLPIMQEALLPGCQYPTVLKGSDVLQFSKMLRLLIYIPGPFCTRKLGHIFTEVLRTALSSPNVTNWVTLRHTGSEAVLPGAPDVSGGL